MPAYRKDSDPDFASMIQPVPDRAAFSEPGYHVWCGTMARDGDGVCHLFYSRWRREFGFEAWVTHSEIAHAVAGDPLGPYQFKDVALPARGSHRWDGLCTHNPTVKRFGGRYYLYYTGDTGDGRAVPGLNWIHRNNQRIGVAVADHPNGPWQRSDVPLIDVTPGFFDALCCNNPSVTDRPDGGYLMVYKAVGNRGEPPFGGPVVHVVATSGDPAGPFTKHPRPVFVKEGVHFPAEDPFIWRRRGQYFAIVKDMGGYFTGAGRSLALFESRDGFDWKLARHSLVSRTAIPWRNGTLQNLYALERPQVWFENGRPAVLFCAADTDEGHTRTFNVQIPLRRVRRILSSEAETR